MVSNELNFARQRGIAVFYCDFTMFIYL